MPQAVPVKKAKDQFSEMVNRARYKGELFLITRKQVPWAIIMGIDEYQKLIDLLDTVSESIDAVFAVGGNEKEAGGTTVDSAHRMVKSKVAVLKKWQEEIRVVQDGEPAEKGKQEKDED